MLSIFSHRSLIIGLHELRLSLSKKSNERYNKQILHASVSKMHIAALIFMLDIVIR